MDIRIKPKVTSVASLWATFMSMLPVTLASSSDRQSHSTATVVLLFLLFIVLCIALVLAWKKLIRTEGGETYHPWEMWRKAQDMVLNVKNQWTQEDKQDESTAEDQNDKDEDVDNQDEEEPDITAL